MREDFAVGTKDELAKRVGYLCANPACRQSTSGPQAEPTGTVNIGVAAHITAAASGGPRFDALLLPQERASSENGIWLCQTCAKLIDSDSSRFTVERLREWKSTAAWATGSTLLSRVITSSACSPQATSRARVATSSGPRNSPVSCEEAHRGQ